MRRSILPALLLVATLSLLLARDLGPTAPDAAAQEEPMHQVMLPILESGRGPGVASAVVVGLPWEPETLYLHGGVSTVQDHVYAAIYDGPFDVLGYEHRPVIVERRPRLEEAGSGAVLRIVSVDPGQAYVDRASGEVRIATERGDDLAQLSARFRLQDGLTWQDGVPVTAADSVLSQRLACDEDSPTNKDLCERTAAYVALDARSVEWTGLPGFPDPLYGTRFHAPLPSHQRGEAGRRMDAMTAVEVAEDEVFARAPLAYGPFRITEWVEGDSIRFARNPHYGRRSEGLPRLAGLEMRFVRDANALLAAVGEGEIDVATRDGLSIAQHDAIEAKRERGELIPHYVDSPIWEHLDFNLDPLDDRPPLGACRDLRRAVAFAIDRATMVDILAKGRTAIRDSFLPAEHWAHPAAGEGITYRYAPEWAKAMLDELGFSDMDGDGRREATRDITCPITVDAAGTIRDQRIPAGTPLELVINTTQGNVLREEITLLAQQNLADVGIDAPLEYLPANFIFSEGPQGPLFGRTFDAAVFAWRSAVMPTARTWGCSGIPSAANGWSGWNLTGWCHPEYERLVADAGRELEREEAVEQYRRAQRIWMDELPTLPLFARVDVLATRPGLEGLRPDSSVASELWNVEEWAWDGARGRPAMAWLGREGLDEEHGPRGAGARPAAMAQAQAPEPVFLPRLDAAPAQATLPPPDGPGADGETGAWEYLLATDAVFDLALEPGAGRVWASGGGLVAWDPATGDSVAHTMNDGLPTNAVGHPTVAGDGRVWVGTRGQGAAWLGEDGRWQRAPFADGALDDILALEVDREGDLWFGTGDGASRLGRDGAWAHFTAFPPNGTVAGTVTQLAFDGAGNRWFGTYYGGLSVWRPDGTWHTYREGDGSGLPSDILTGIVADPEDRLWATWFEYVEAEGGGLEVHNYLSIRATDGTWSPFDLEQLPVTPDSFGGVAFDPEGRPWFRTTDGLLEPDGAGSWLRIGLADGLPSDVVRDILFDEAGRPWVATDRGIAYRQADGRWRTFQRGGLRASYVHDVAIGPDGAAWLATNDGLVSRRPDGTWSRRTAADGLFSERVAHVAADARGGVWLASGELREDEGRDHGGLHYLDAEGDLSSYAVGDGPLSISILDIALGGKGDAFFAHGTYFYAPLQRRDGGLAIHHADGRWTGHARGAGLPGGGDPQALALDTDGTLWIGTRIISGAPDESLARRLPDGRFEIVALPDSLPSRQIQSLAIGPDGRLWVGAFGEVVVRERSGRWITSADDPALAFRAETMTRAPDGSLWFGETGRARVRRPDGRWASFAAADGLAQERVGAIAAAPDGAVWFAGGGRGVSILRGDG